MDLETIQDVVEDVIEDDVQEVQDDDLMEDVTYEEIVDPNAKEDKNGEQEPKEETSKIKSTIDVLIKVNENNEIIDLQSEIFLKDKNNYIVIDTGVGDKFSHAQSQYLDKPLYDDLARPNYKWEDDKVVEIKEEDKQPINNAIQLSVEERLEVVEALLLEQFMEE